MKALLNRLGRVSLVLLTPVFVVAAGIGLGLLLKIKFLQVAFGIVLGVAVVAAIVWVAAGMFVEFINALIRAWRDE